MVTVDQFASAWVKFNELLHKSKNADRIDDFLNRYKLITKVKEDPYWDNYITKDEIRGYIKEMIALFQLTFNERSAMAFESSTSGLNDLKKLQSALNNMEWAYDVYKIDKDQITKDIEKLKERATHRGIKRSHLFEIKNRLKSIYPYLKANGFTPTKKDEFIYDLFCEFEFEDYGKGGNDYIKVEGEISDFEAKQREKVKKIRLDCEKYPKGWL